MPGPSEIYDLLLDYATSQAPIRRVVVGQVWTYCEAEAVGLAMSPGTPTRTLRWAGTLRGRPLAEVAAWVKGFDPFEASVGMAAINAGLNRFDTIPASIPLDPQSGAANNLAVFEHFLPQLAGGNVVVIGRYPGLSRFAETHDLDLTVLERQPGEGDLPDSAAEYLVPRADWVFMTASTLVNKTFPRLADLACNAITVLLGPTTPWLPELYHFGIDYLAGVEVLDAEQLLCTVGEGGGVRIFDGPVRYRVAAIGIDQSKVWARRLIAETFGEREQLKHAMDAWYQSGNARRFPELERLETVTQRLSRLDTCFKRLWDEKPDSGPLLGDTRCH